MTELACCVDFGSTYTKAALVDLAGGGLVGSATHRTTVDTDVLDGWDACLDQLAAADRAARSAPVVACSSAGGGLRIAVVGNEELVTAEAGRRVALSSGGRVVAVVSGGLSSTGYAAVRAADPDVVLLVGGTDGGNAETMLDAAATLAAHEWAAPVVVAGNVDVQPDVADLLAGAGTPHVRTDNVVPRIGVLRPDGARAAIREMFVNHVIGGKQLSRRADFTAMVHGATPDVVLTAVEVIAQHVGDVAVVDVGGATTDVHSVVEVDPEDAGLGRQVVAAVPVSRTVEGDLGMRWSAVDTVRAGDEAGLVTSAELHGLRDAAHRRHTDPALLPGTPAEHRHDRRLAEIAVGVALRRHGGRQQVSFGPDGRLVERNGKDLREVGLLIGSGGVLRHHAPDAGHDVLRSACGEHIAGGWLLPRDPRIVVDRDYVLAAVGLLADEHPQAAVALLAPLLEGRTVETGR
ncbi:MAG TPA: glutamate mutase L [Nocardioidaceae bacterium]|nr:glutamate mutase L [Nocardioidaceae bacterium]